MIYIKRHIKMNGDIFQNHDSTKWINSAEDTCKNQQTNQFLMFCDVILKYEKYKLPADEMNDSAYSPSGSDGTNDSFSNESNSSFNSGNLSSDDMKSETVGHEDDSWDLITCPCMKPFAGRPMIECSICQNWLHMSCAKVRKNNIPDDFICSLCRETKSNKRRSERIKSDDRGFAILR
ncbi:PHD finger protein 23 [Parasteatoda tepidariorum]|uniref:PHD finger protein 23 n=1 Tax=Parasteatoda tepidariorum TaxID=114398 RepID=UPI00077F93EC|nr:PHD finger protein 23 [Parasteatoda tepidariorum]